ncbi:MAG TPA: sigma 54-interacting transcriptional regulator [candidate division Zixibacteria bacterium]|nr:sigma 54-interacting transcriptional regulator [candidate division Zixibacteria bacterium]
MDRAPLQQIDVDAALRTIVEGTATETGEQFFRALVRSLAAVLGTHGAWVTEYFPEARRLKALAFWMDTQWLEGWEMVIDGTPCERVIHERCLIHIPDNLLHLYGDDPDVRATGAASYMGMPLLDLDGRCLGHLAVLDKRPMPAEPRAQALFHIFAARAAAELRRLRAERQVLEREQKLARLLGSAMDAIIELDRHLRVTQMNPAAEKVFGCAAVEAAGQTFTQFLTPESREKFARLIIDLDTRSDGQRCLWIAGGLNARSRSGDQFSAEATLSRFDLEREPFYTLILRNVNERLEAERKIQSLTVETEYLREELKSLIGADEIIGRSEALLRVLGDVKEVATTDATVLILGETGTGKELIARAIHAASRRRDRPLIKVNCAAIPAALIESEFFGHEQGAFTGATKRRDGRFALAHGGTIFLDEVGELPLDLQSKLLRVLQEGEFEPVGSSQTRKVDVRVIAATNRELDKLVREGKFREDLFYRLNVFPIKVPALRERREDISVLANAFARKFARRMGRRLEPISEDCFRRLEAYPWPGNVRELQNIIERAVITSRDGRLNLDRALPESATAPATAATESAGGQRVRTARELEELERQNIIAALETADWKISGPNGAAQLLGLKPTTLSSRMKILGIERKR